MNNKKMISAAATKKNKPQKLTTSAKNANKKPGKPVVNKSPSNPSHNTSSKKKQRHTAEFESQMNKVNGLIREGNIRQAYAAIPNEIKFPEQAPQIKALKSQLMDRIWKL